MNKIRVIDLLNKIANSKAVPVKIKVYNDIYEYNTFNKSYWNKQHKNLLELYNGYILTYEVEIIEDTPEENNIKEIFALNTDSYAEDVYYEKLSKEEICLDIQSLKHKINEIIDKIKGE